MAYDNNGFMEKLRLNNVFPAEGRGNPSPLIGMPDFTYPQGQQGAVQQAPQRGIERVANFVQPEKPKWNPPLTEPKNTAWVPGAADVNAGRIVMGETPNENLDRAITLQGTKNQAGLQKNSIAAFKAQNPNMKFITMKGGNVVAFDPLTGEAHDTGVSSGTLTEEDKQLLVGGQAAERNDASIAGRADVADKNIAGRKDVAGMNNAASAERNNASIAGRSNVAGMNNSARAARDQSLQPSQQRVEQNNEARRLAQDPYLAQFIQIEPNGNFAIIGNPPLDVLSKIQNALYKPKDIALPSDNTNGNVATKAPLSSQPGTPVSKTPTANMSLPKKSVQEYIEQYGKP